MKKFVPRPYQLEALGEIVQDYNKALFIAPGGGKTAITLQAFVNMKRLGKVNAMLLVAPLLVAYSTWEKEVKKWAFSHHLTTTILHGPNKAKNLQTKADIYIINYEGLKWLFTYGLKRRRNYPFDMLVCDESGKLKNPDSKTLQLLKPKLKKFKSRVVLNGTPAPNSLLDIWSQLLIVDMGQTFGRKITHFRNQYFYRTGYMGKQWKLNPGDGIFNPKENIFRRASKICIVIPESVTEKNLPPRVPHLTKLQLPPKARQVYEELEGDLFTAIEEVDYEIANSAVATGACRQVCSGAIYHPQPEDADPIPAAKRKYDIIHKEKLEFFMNLIAEMSGQPLLIAFTFYHSYKILSAEIKKRFKFTPHYIGAGSNAKHNSQVEALWNAGEVRVLLGQPKSMSYGLNMQDGGSHIAWYDLIWELEVFYQYCKRLHREGQKDTVHIHVPYFENTIEAVILSRLRKKHLTQEEFKSAIQRYRKIKTAQKT